MFKNNSTKLIAFILLIALAITSPLPSQIKTLLQPIQVVAGINDQPSNQSTQTQEATATEENQKRLTQSVPPPVLQDSIERRNLKERLNRNNKADKIGYVFLLSDTGSIITSYTIKGKVSSLNSLLTTPQQLVADNWCQNKKGSNTACQSQVVDSPDFDGSYGKNPEGVFFFTTDGNMVEWSGKYLYSEQPMTLSSAPVLTYQVK
jgi:hypothetical protein